MKTRKSRGEGCLLVKKTVRVTLGNTKKESVSTFSSQSLTENITLELGKYVKVIVVVESQVPLVTLVLLGDHA